MFNNVSREFFILAFVLIIVAYYVGSTNVAQAFFNGVVRLSYAWTGRTPNGQFANYPGGGGQPAV
jgi:hypothetical protein